MCSIEIPPTIRGNCELMSASNSVFIQRLRSFCSGVGLFVKPEETWGSSTITCYNKKISYCSAPVPSDLKVIARGFGGNNGAVASLMLYSYLQKTIEQAANTNQNGRPQSLPYRYVVKFFEWYHLMYSNEPTRCTPIAKDPHGLVINLVNKNDPMQMIDNPYLENFRVNTLGSDPPLVSHLDKLDQLVKNCIEEVSRMAALEMCNLTISYLPYLGC